MRWLFVLVLSFAALAAHADKAKVCPFKPEELSKVFGIKFDTGTVEPGIGGSSCKYKTIGGSLKDGTDFPIWVFQLEPGPSQDTILKFTLGPPKTVKITPVHGDPDGAQTAQNSNASDMVDVFYKRNGWVVILRASSSTEATRPKRIEQLLGLPRLH